MTKREWQRKAEQMIRTANSDAAGFTTLTWQSYRNRVTYPTGYRGRDGQVVASAPGFRPKLFSVTSDLDGTGMMAR